MRKPFNEPAEQKAISPSFAFAVLAYQELTTNPRSPFFLKSYLFPFNPKAEAPKNPHITTNIVKGQ